MSELRVDPTRRAPAYGVSGEWGQARELAEAEDRVYIAQLCALLPDKRDQEIAVALYESANTAEAARVLGMSRPVLYRAIERLAPILGPFFGR